MNDLHLKYKFTDRGGAKVYEKYASEDRIQLLKPLGEVRLSDNKTDSGKPLESLDKPSDYSAFGYTEPVVKQEDCWASCKKVTCECSRCISKRRIRKRKGHGTG
jgi:hypothetical protein